MMLESGVEVQFAEPQMTEPGMMAANPGSSIRNHTLAPHFGGFSCRSLFIWTVIWIYLGTIMIPAHQSSRLTLGVPVVDDDEAVIAIAQDPRTWSHAPGARSDDAQASSELLAMFREGWTAHGLSHWVVRLGDGQVCPGLKPGMILGTGGVHMFEPVGPGPFWNLGYRFMPASWGQGFATEVASLALALARKTDPDVPVIARVLSTNPASMRVAFKAGLRLVWQGAPSKETIAAVGLDSVQRKIFADRELSPDMLAWLVSRG